MTAGRFDRSSPTSKIGERARSGRKVYASEEESGQRDGERGEREEMRLLQWLPLPSIFVLSSVMRRLYRVLRGR